MQFNTTEDTTDDTMPLIELLRKCGADKEIDLLRIAVEDFLARLMEAQVSDRVGQSSTAGFDET